MQKHLYPSWYDPSPSCSSICWFNIGILSSVVVLMLDSPLTYEMSFYCCYTYIFVCFFTHYSSLLWLLKLVFCFRQTQCRIQKFFCFFWCNRYASFVLLLFFKKNLFAFAVAKYWTTHLQKKLLKVHLDRLLWYKLLPIYFLILSCSVSLRQNVLCFLKKSLCAVNLVSMFHLLRFGTVG